MNRRTILKALAGAPIVGKLAKSALEAEPELEVGIDHAKPGSEETLLVVNEREEMRAEPCEPPGSTLPGAAEELRAWLEKSGDVIQFDVEVRRAFDEPIVGINLWDEVERLRLSTAAVPTRLSVDATVVPYPHAGANFLAFLSGGTISSFSNDWVVTEIVTRYEPEGQFVDIHFEHANMSFT